HADRWCSLVCDLELGQTGSNGARRGHDILPVLQRRRGGRKTGSPQAPDPAAGDDLAIAAAHRRQDARVEVLPEQLRGAALAGPEAEILADDQFAWPQE